ncbi:MAG: oligosaccharide flippase family protein [Chloroflexi bacterium]|nr:oligosaccharide flippase family protein [Chloroflexota bacterium]
MKASRKPDVAIVVFLLLLPLLWFAPQVVGGKTLLPADNLFAFEPWRSFAAEAGVTVPHNGLISDLILENYGWKSLIVEALRSGRPADILWNPRLFSGVPFLAAGQHSALYPLSVIFYILPLWRAYGVFTWLQLGLAAAGMYFFARVLRQSRPAATLAAIAYTFSGFMIVSVNFSMVIAAAAWLPPLLAMIELVVRETGRQGDKETDSHLVTPSPGRLVTSSPVPYVAAGALLLGIQTLAGHVEITLYVLLVSAFYAAWRLVALGLRARHFRSAWHVSAKAMARTVGWLLAMVGLGLAIGAVQLIPLYELVKQNFREGSASLAQIRGWAWPSRQIVTFLLPDFFGNPTAHTYFDIWSRQWLPVTQNALGDPINTIDWGVKNYVEGGNYLGIVTLLLAAVAGLQIADCRLQIGRRRSPQSDNHATRNTQHVVLFAVLAALSLLFAFGTPLYAILYYGVPGWSQLHSAFRWVFPYTLSMAVLAGFGLDALLGANCRLQIADGRLTAAGEFKRRAARILGASAALGGIAALGVVALSLVVPGPFVALGDKLLVWSDLAREKAFATGAMAWSYEAVGLARFGVMAVLAGVVLWALGRRGNKETREQGVAATSPRHLVTLSACHRIWPFAAVALLVADLWLFGHNFNSAVDPKLLDFKPQVIQWLQDRQHDDESICNLQSAICNLPWRLTTFNLPDEKTLNANTATLYGLEDVRGYDSIIPKQYAAFMDRIQPQAGELLYNRIAPIYAVGAGLSSSVENASLPEKTRPYNAALDSRLLDLLGVRYVVTTQTIPNAGYALAYDREVKVYENRDAFPRVFIVPQAVTAPDQQAALDALEKLDPAQTVVVEGFSGPIPAAASPQLREARISLRTNREVFVDVNVSDRGWLVFTDAYFDGWKAYIRPFGVQGEGVTASGESVEQQTPIYRADGAFRAVYLAQAGQWTVRFVYSPRNLLLGLYASFLAGVILLMLAGWWAWNRFYRGPRSEVGTVAKNSAVQMAMSLLSKGIDFAFAMLRLRVLSPGGEGSYAFAITFYGVFEILTRFGLGTLLTRDVAFDRKQAGRYLTNVVALRSGLWLLSLPVMVVVGLIYQQGGRLTPQEAQAIVLFAAALFFANIADAISSVFNAFEKMEYPAGLATAVAVAKVALGALVLLPPLELGFVGLAGISLVMNVVQVVWLYVVLRRTVLPQGSKGAEEQRSVPLPPRPPAPPRLGIDWSLQRHMLRESGPLMLNHLLASVFWRIDLWVLQYFSGAVAVGIFSAGVKYLDGLNVIPAYFTLAIFPLLSRYAAAALPPAGSGGEAGGAMLAKAYRLASQLLFIAALPVAVFFSFAATPLIQILGGAAYLPDSATALAIMIWSIPLGFVNSVTQYVLIAVNQQRFLTRAFIIGVLFTGLANLIFVPRYGYLAAAAILIPAELSLFIPFYWAVRKHVTAMPWARLLGGPLLAAGADAAVIWGLGRVGIPLLVALAAGFVAYVAVLLALGTFRGDDFAVLRARLPQIRVRRR